MTDPALSAKFVPTPTPDTEQFWQACNEGRLMLPSCSVCGPFFYPRSWCPRCGRSIEDWQEMSGFGRIYSYVINHRPAPGYESGSPYFVALVELAEGPRILSNVVGVPPDANALPIEAPVRVEFEQRGEQAIPVFRPVAEIS